MNIVHRTSHTLHHIRKTIGVLHRNWIITTTTKFIFLFTIASIAIIIWRWQSLPPQIPLWYTQPWGAERLASPVWIFLLPGGSFFWYLASTLVSIYATEEYLVFTQLIYLCSFLVSILSFVTLLQILFLVT